MTLRALALQPVAVATVGGVLLWLALLLGQRSLDNEDAQQGPHSLASERIERCHAQANRWAEAVRLVLQGRTDLLLPARQQATELLRLIDQLRGSPLAIPDHARLATIYREIVEANSLVVRRAWPQDDGRSAPVGASIEGRLAALLAETDLVRVAMTARAEDTRHRLRAQRQQLELWTMLAACIYLLSVALAWLMTTIKVIKPAQAMAQHALGRRGPLTLTGAEELKAVGAQLLQLTNDCQTARQQTEAEVARRTQTLVKANIAKSAFLATMSHELRTPLNGIIGMSELLLDTGLDRAQTQYTQMARSAAEALLQVIDDILDFSKIESGKLLLQRVMFSPRTVVEEVQAILAPQADSQDLRLRAIVDHRVPATVLGDPVRLRQVLLNLGNNALKFTEQGSVTILVSSHTDGPGYLLRCEVLDTGIGVPPDQRDVLFESFTQGDSSATRRHGGTGLGLAICKRLTELMGGTIGCESDPGRGSLFWFTVRLERGRPRSDPAPLACPVGLRVGLALADHALCESLVQQLLALGVEPARIAPSATGPGSLAIIHLADLAGSAERAAARLRTMVETADHVVVIVGLGEGLPDHLQGIGPLTVLEEPVTLASWRSPFERLVAPPPKPPAKPEDHRHEPPADDARRVKILIAEDNAINQKVALAVLQRQGYACELAVNGQQVLDYLGRKRCDLILMDCQMPVLDGLATVKRIRQLEAAGALAAGNPPRMPVIALTANAVEGTRELCLAAGMDCYLTKPLKPAMLLAAIESVLESKTAESISSGCIEVTAAADPAHLVR